MEDPIKTPPSNQRPERWMPILGKQRKLFIGIIVLGAVFGYFGFTAFNNATMYYLTVDEAIERSTELENETFQIKGSLVPESFRRSDSGTIAYFTLQEASATIDATYDGIFPDLFFNEHSEIVLQGTFVDSNMFVADQILVKCPSKYQEAEQDDV